MRILVILFLIFQFISVSGQDNAHRNFTITIEESCMVGVSKTVITKDSIVTKSQTKEFRKALLINEQKKITRLLYKINFDKLKDSYINEMVDDHYEFGFVFDVNDRIKRTTIYGVRHKAIFKLVEQINAMIPSDFEIHYDDKYLKSFVIE